MKMTESQQNKVLEVITAMTDPPVLEYEYNMPDDIRVRREEQRIWARFMCGMEDDFEVIR